MRIPRIHHPQPLGEGETVQLESGAAQHVARVLRLGVGAELILFDGRGGHYPAQIITVDKRHVEVKLGQQHRTDNTSPLRITLAQGISKGERMDFTIQKAVELGVQRIVPLDTERSVVRLKGERLERKHQHWQGIIISACEQSGRDVLPELLPSRDLNQWLGDEAEGVRLLLDPYAERGISELTPGTEITLLIGPEGGLSEQERQAAQDAGYQGVRLGPRVLRTETAALAAVAILQSHWGDLG